MASEPAPNSTGADREAWPSSPLTARQWELFNFIVRFTKEHFYQPSIHEMAKEFGIRSMNGIVVHLKAMSRKGLIGGASMGRSRALQLNRRTPLPREAMAEGGEIPAEPHREEQDGAQVWPTSPLTYKQWRMFNYIIEYTHANGFQPTFREMQGAMGVSSPLAVSQHIKRLIAKGVLGGLGDSKSRSLEVLRRTTLPEAAIVESERPPQPDTTRG